MCMIWPQDAQARLMLEMQKMREDSEMRRIEMETKLELAREEAAAKRASDSITVQLQAMQQSNAILLQGFLAGLDKLVEKMSK